MSDCGKKAIKDNLEGVFYNAEQYYQALLNQNTNDQDTYKFSEFYFSEQIKTLLGEENYHFFSRELHEKQADNGCTRGVVRKIIENEGIASNAENEYFRCLGIAKQAADKLIDEMFEYCN